MSLSQIPRLLSQSVRLAPALHARPSAAIPALTAAFTALRVHNHQLPQQQRRPCSHSSAATGLSLAALRPSVPLAVQKIQQQQKRGMKVHSSVKRRCEHCKVSLGRGGCRPESEERIDMTANHWMSQVVRRKGGKRHKGYMYIICPANPRHKQRQG